MIEIAFLDVYHLPPYLWKTYIICKIWNFAIFRRASNPCFHSLCCMQPGVSIREKMRKSESTRNERNEREERKKKAESWNAKKRRERRQQQNEKEAMGEGSPFQVGILFLSPSFFSFLSAWIRCFVSEHIFRFHLHFPILAPSQSPVILGAEFEVIALEIGQAWQDEKHVRGWRRGVWSTAHARSWRQNTQILWGRSFLPVYKKLIFIGEGKYFEFFHKNMKIFAI